MKTSNGKIVCLLCLFIVLSISCNKDINIKDYFGECEFSSFVAPYDKIDEKRIARLQIPIGCRGDRSLNSCENPN